MTPYNEMPAEQTAYHEAGHAVVALRLGWTIETVTLIPGTDASTGASRDYEGQVLPVPHHLSCRTEMGKRMAIARLKRQFIIVSYAGPQAAIKQFGADIGPRHWPGDLKIIDQYLSELSVSQRGLKACQDYKDRCSQEALQQVDRLWAAITLVAGELLKRGTLTGEALQAIVGDMVR